MKLFLWLSSPELYISIKLCKQKRHLFSKANSAEKGLKVQ